MLTDQPSWPITDFSSWRQRVTVNYFIPHSWNTNSIVWITIVSFMRWLETKTRYRRIGWLVSRKEWGKTERLFLGILKHALPLSYMISLVYHSTAVVIPGLKCPWKKHVSKKTRMDIGVSIPRPCTMDVHSSIFKWMDFCALAWTLHGHFNPGHSHCTSIRPLKHEFLQTFPILAAIANYLS